MPGRAERISGFWGSRGRAGKIWVGLELLNACWAIRARCHRPFTSIGDGSMFYCPLRNASSYRYTRIAFGRMFLRRLQVACGSIVLMCIGLAASPKLAAQSAPPDEPVAQTAQSQAPANPPGNAPSQPSTEGTATASDDSEDKDVLTLFPHSQTSRYWISGQANVVFQWHDTFPAAFSGKNSFRAGRRECDVEGIHAISGLRTDSHDRSLFWMWKAPGATG